MATAKVATDICNLALSHINAKSIQSLSILDESKEYQESVRWYDTTRTSLLRQYEWNFALTSNAVMRISGTPTSGYADSYYLPADLLKLVSLYDNRVSSTGRVQYNIGTTDLNYSLRGKELHINAGGESKLSIDYIRDEEEVGLFDPLFIETLALQLAVNMAYRFTAKKSLIDLIMQLLNAKRQEAYTQNNQEKPLSVKMESEINRVRGMLSTEDSHVTGDLLRNELNRKLGRS